MIKKACFSIFLVSSILATTIAVADIHEGPAENPMELMLKINMNELSEDDKKSIIEILDKSGSVPMTHLYSRQTMQVMPGSLTAEEGLDFIPDQEDAVDTYLTLIEQGVIPFAAIFLTNEAILSAMKES